MSNVHLLSFYSRVKNDRATNKCDQKHSELNIWLFIWSDTRYNSLDHVPLYLERKIDKNISEQKRIFVCFTISTPSSVDHLSQRSHNTRGWKMTVTKYTSQWRTDRWLGDGQHKFEIKIVIFWVPCVAACVSVHLCFSNISQCTKPDCENIKRAMVVAVAEYDDTKEDVQIKVLNVTRYNCV